MRLNHIPWVAFWLGASLMACGSGNNPPIITTNCQANLTSDPKNCGYCGHDCQGSTCQASVCQSMALAMSLRSPQDIVADGTNVYWTDSSGPVFKMAATGGTPTMQATGNTPRGIAVDQTNLYWAELGTSRGNFRDGAVMRLALAGGSPTPLASAQSAPSQIAIDGSNAYWINTGSTVNNFMDRAVMRVGLGGGTPMMMTAIPQANNPSGIAVDGSNVYWSVEPLQGTDGAVMRLPLGGGMPTMVAGAQRLPGVLAIDGSSLYWADNGDGNVVKADKNTGALTTLANGPHADQVAVDDTGLYFTAHGNSGSDGTVVKVSLGGGTAVPLATGQSSPRGIAVDGMYVYWTSAGSGSGHGTIMKTAK